MFDNTSIISSFEKNSSGNIKLSLWIFVGAFLATVPSGREKNQLVGYKFNFPRLRNDESVCEEL
jgi:hypothetical protein